MIRYKKFIVILRNILCILIFVLVMSIYKAKEMHIDEVMTKMPSSALKYLLFEESRNSYARNISVIKRLINRYNSEEKILSSDTFGNLKADTPIFVISVYKFSVYLKYLLVSLSQIQGIQEVLIIFSHSYFDDNINTLIQSIDFCRVLQIFYPYSIQVYPQKFPGFHSHDCPYGIDMKTAETMNCTGAFTPDIHGRYRNPFQTQKKHHWWWTANHVFEKLRCTKDYNGIVIFLEDDYYLLEDFIYMVLYMKKVAESLPQGELLSLGSIPFSDSNENNTYLVEVTTWDPKYHSSVLAFDLSVWNSIVSHYNLFCHIDDFSWSRSLYYLSLNRKDGKRYNVLSSVMPRAYKTSLCGLYSYGKAGRCDVIESALEVLHLQDNKKASLFPPYLEVYVNIELEEDEYVVFDYVDGNGGWNDPRDKGLCINITHRKIKKILMHMENDFIIY